MLRSWLGLIARAPSVAQRQYSSPSQPQDPSPAEINPSASSLLVKILRDTRKDDSQPTNWGTGSFHRASSIYLRSLFPILDLRKSTRASETVPGVNFPSSKHTRKFFMDRGSSLNTLLSSYCDHLRTSERFPPPLPRKSDTLSTPQEQQELVWFLEEIPLQQETTSILRLMQLCTLKRCNELALTIFSLWCGVRWSHNSNALGLFAQDPTTTLNADFASEDAQRHHASFPFDNTLSLRAAEGGLLGAASHAKSPLCIRCWTLIVTQHAMRSVRGNPSDICIDGVMFSDFLFLMQRWWSHTLVSRDEWASLQQLLVEMAAAAIAEVVVRNLPSREILEFVESAQPSRGLDVGSPTSRPYEVFCSILRDVAIAIEGSWMSAALRDDPRLSIWFSGECRRIGDTALVQFAQHFLFQREFKLDRFFNTAQPWIRLSTHLEFLTLTPTRSPTVADVFRRLWLLHLSHSSSSFTSDSETVGRKITVANWMRETSKNGSSRALDENFSAMENLKASRARNALVATLMHDPNSAVESSVDQSWRPHLLHHPTLKSLPPQVAYHRDATHEAIQLILWTLTTHFAHSTVRDSPQTPQSDVLMNLAPVYLAALSALTSLGDEAATEALLADVRCPPAVSTGMLTADGTDVGGDKLDEGVGSLFVRGLGRSGNDSLAVSLNLWWCRLLHHSHSDSQIATGAHDIPTVYDLPGELTDEAHRVIFYYWARTVGDVVAEAELFQSLLWQPSFVEGMTCSSRPRWLRFLSSAMRRASSEGTTLAPINVSWMVRASWDYLLTLSLARDLPPPALVTSSASTAKNGSCEAVVESLRRQVLQLLLLCMIPPSAGTTFVEDDVLSLDIVKLEKLTGKKVALLRCLSDAMNGETDPSPHGEQPRELFSQLRDAVVASICGGDAAGTLTRRHLFSYATLGRTSGGNGGGAVQHSAVMEKVLGTVLTLFWHDCELLQLFLPLVETTHSSKTQEFVPPLIVSILCRQLVLFPTPKHRELVEPFLLGSVFQKRVDSGDVSAAERAQHQKMSELIAQNYYVREAYTRLCCDSDCSLTTPGDMEQSSSQKKSFTMSPVLFPSLQLQDHREVVQTLESTKRRSVLPFSLTMWHGDRSRSHSVLKTSPVRGSGGLRRGGTVSPVTRTRLTAHAASALLATRCPTFVSVSNDSDAPQLLTSRDPLSEDET